MNEDKTLRRLSIVLVSILIAILLLLMAYVQLAQAEDIPYPPDNDKCDNGYILFWSINNCKYCKGMGTYYLFMCHDYDNNKSIFKSVCLYPSAHAEDIYFNYLPVIGGVDTILGIPPMPIGE